MLSTTSTVFRSGLNYKKPKPKPNSIAFSASSPSLSNTGTATLQWTVAQAAPVEVTWSPTTSTAQPVSVQTGTSSTTVSGFLAEIDYTFTLKALASLTTQESQVTSAPVKYAVQTGNLQLTASSSSIGYNNICCSTNGQYIYVASQSQGLGISSTHGQTFTMKTSIASGNFTLIGNVDCSDDGSKVWLGIGGRLYRSTNYGDTFTVIPTSKVPSQQNMVCDGTGDYVAYSIYGDGIYWYNSITDQAFKIYNDNTSGYLGVGMAKQGPLIIFSGNSKGQTGTALTGYLKTSYASITSTSVTNTSWTIVNNNVFDQNCQRFGLSANGANIYMPVSGGNTLGVWQFTNTTTTITETSNRIADAKISRAVGYKSATVESDKNFAAASTAGTTAGNSKIYYTSDGGTTWTNISPNASSNNGAEIHLASYMRDSSTVVLLVASDTAATNSLTPYRRVFNL